MRVGWAGGGGEAAGAAVGCCDKDGGAKDVCVHAQSRQAVVAVWFRAGGCGCGR